MTEPDAADEAPPTDRMVRTSRLYAAPRQAVWDAWTDPERLARWWGPKGFTNTFHECDPRPGGRWRFVMNGPNGAGYPNESVFAEAVPLERIVVDHLSAPKFRLTAGFAEEGAGTRVTWQQAFGSAEECAKLRPLVLGANEENLDRLGAELARTR